MLKKKKKNKPKKNNNIIKKKNIINQIRNNLEELKTENLDDDYNNFTYEAAKKFDKRNIFQIFKSILFNKLELINIFLSNKKMRIICICEFILSLLFDFFFNTLLYSDDVVSHKYHNNGKLEYIVSITYLFYQILFLHLYLILLNFLKE